MTPAHSDPLWLTLHDAAKAFDVSLSTLHRRRRSGDLEQVGAFKDADGTWKVPRQGLARLGFKELLPPVSPGQVTLEETLSDLASEVPVTTPADTLHMGVETAEVERLKQELLEATHRMQLLEAERQAAERLAAERLTHIEDMRQSMRLLEAPKSDSAAQLQTDQKTASAETVQRPRKWWRFGL